LFTSSVDVICFAYFGTEHISVSYALFRISTAEVLGMP